MTTQSPATLPIRLTLPRGIAGAEAGSLIMEDELLDEHELVWVDDTDDDHAGWFCVRTDPFPARPRAAPSWPTS